MKNKILSILSFFRITDENQKISITNIFMFIIMYKLMETKALSMEDISLFLVAITNYNYKKHISKGE